MIMIGSPGAGKTILIRCLPNHLAEAIKYWSLNRESWVG
ncbi:MAG: ATP-binding protein [Bacteroidales bacterium]|nr:MAG: ATP-binding protein [Bacteroidales bacterium]